MHDSEVEELSADVVFELLADTHRRYILSFLQDRDGQVTTSDLARNISSIQGRASDNSTSDPEQIHIELYHVHLPKLADANVVEYDPEQMTVGHGESFHEIDSLLREIPSIEGNFIA